MNDVYIACKSVYPYGRLGQISDEYQKGKRQTSTDLTSMMKPKNAACK